MKARSVSEVPSTTTALAQPPLGEVLEFMRLLWAVAQGLSVSGKVTQASLGVTDLQRMVLQLAEQSPGITATRLAGVLHIHPSTLTGVVKRLVKRGYLLRQEDPHDMRRALLYVTDAGRALDVPTATGEAAVQRLLLRLPEESLAEARELLTALAEELHRTEASARAHGESSLQLVAQPEQVAPAHLEGDPLEVTHGPLPFSRTEE